MRTAPVIKSDALRDKPVNLYSNLLIHHMGSNLADNIIQGLAGPDMFRTNPPGGVGQRIFFLHDGRTSNLLDAIEAHFSPAASANSVTRMPENAGAGPIRGEWIYPGFQALFGQ